MKRLIAIGASLVFLACSDSNGPNGGPHLSNVAVSFAATSPTSAAPLTAPGGAASAQALVLTSVGIVLREVELKRLEAADCDIDPEPDGCEKFEAGPFLAQLPLDGTVEATFELAIDTGHYVQIEFDIHKVSSGDAQDAAFIAQHPEFADLSIRVEGTFDGNPFVFTTDLDVEQELQLLPVLVIDENTTATNVTVLVDLDAWFRAADGSILDPETGNKGGQNESVIKENIKQSVEAFEDDDRDGSRT